jgi:hypothetical protein
MPLVTSGNKQTRARARLHAFANHRWYHTEEEPFHRGKAGTVMPAFAAIAVKRCRLPERCMRLHHPKGRRPLARANGASTVSLRADPTLRVAIKAATRQLIFCL